MRIVKGARPALLGLFASSAAVRGAMYIEAPDTGLISFVDGIIPLFGWVIVWWVSAVALLAAIFVRPITRWAMAFGSALWGLWAVSYYLEWFAEGGRGWGTGYLFFTMFVGMTIAATQMEAQRPSEVPPRDSPEAE